MSHATRTGKRKSVRPAAGSRKRLNIPPLETIPDLGVSPEAAKLIRVAVWLERAAKEIEGFLDGLSLRGSRDVNYDDALGELSYGFWILALANIAGPDMRAKAEIDARREEYEAIKAARGEGGEGASHAA